MANIEGLFNIASFEEAADNDILGMNINESDETKDKCPSMDIELHLDPTSSGNKEIPVPGGDKEEPTADADEKEIPVPGGDKEEPAADADEKEIPVPAKVTIDSKTYNTAIDNLTKSFKEAVNVLDSFKYVNVVEESVEDQYNEYMESAMDNAFVEFAEGPLFESLNREDQEEIKKVIKNVKDSIYDFAEEAGYKMYKPNMFLRSLFDNKNNVVYMSAKAATYSAQIVGMALMPPKDVDAFEKALNNKYKDDLNGYKIYLLQSSYSYTDLLSKKRLRGEKGMGAYLVFIDKDVPKVLKDYLKDEKKEEKKEEK